MNPERVSVLDIDFDISGLTRAQVLNHLREVYGQDKACNVLTLRTEKSKSAILTAARGLGMSPEEGQYLASLVTSERGQLYSLKKMYYGDKDNDISPSSTGGEPFQIYYMNKRGLKGEVATSVPLMKYISWQIGFVLTSFIFLIANYNYLMTQNSLIVTFAWVGFGINSAILFVVLLLSIVQLQYKQIIVIVEFMLY